MTWTASEWDAFCALVDEGWPGTFDDTAAQSWRVLLDIVEPAEAVTALRRLLFEGGRFRPSVSELLAKVREDPSTPTWPEAYRLIFGPGGVLAARPSGGRWESNAEWSRLHNQAAVDRAGQLHPLIGGFVRAQGIERLRRLPVDCPDWGEKTRRDLKAEFEQYAQANQGRQVAALAAGTGRDGLHQLDPLAGLNLPDPAGLLTE